VKLSYAILLAIFFLSCGDSASFVVEEREDFAIEKTGSGDATAGRTAGDQSSGLDQKQPSRKSSKAQKVSYGDKDKKDEQKKNDDGGEDTPPPIDPALALTSDPILYGQSGATYTYEMAWEANTQDAVTVELAQAPMGMTVSGSTVSWMPQNGNVEMTQHPIKLKVTLASNPPVVKTQDYMLTINSTCVESIINQVATIRTDDDGNLVKTDLGSFVAYKGTEDAATNYNYYSYSAHPKVGPTPKGFFESVFMYIDGEGKSYLNIFWGVDEGGSEDNVVNVDILTTGNTNQDAVVLADDSGEINKVSSGAAGNFYEGRFRYWKNTDGAVIGPFTGTDYKIHVAVLNGGDNKDAKFYSQDQNDLTLLDGGTLSSFEISFKEVRTCQ